MKKSLVLIFYLVTIQLSLFAQKNGGILSSAKYRVVYLKNDKSLVDDICQLDITKDQSYFYSLHAIEDMNLLEAKWQKAKSSNSKMEIDRNDIRTNIYKFNTIKKYSENQSIVTENIGGQLFGYVRDTLSNMKWNILKEKTLIGKLLCQKAEIKKGNIKTIAWFSTDLPLQEDPFYYYGLPGLIVKLNNSLGWEATLISTDLNTRDKNDMYIWPYTLITRKQFDKAKINNESMLRNGKLPNGGNFEKSDN